jgi:hypothetical protein
MSGTPHRSLLLATLVAAHRQKVLPEGGATPKEITGRARHPGATSRELRLLEVGGFVKGEGWPLCSRRYTPTLKGLRAATEK